MTKRIRRLLYRSFDQPLDAQEQTDLERALHQSGELANEHRQVSALRQHLLELSAANVEPFFAERVKNRLLALRQPQDLFYSSLLRTFRPVLVAASICIIAFIALHFFSAASSSTGSMLSSSSSLEELYSSAFTPSLEDLL